ncbi:MAG: galactose mutarotase [Ruminococcaceae bacterium]|nr:galactose mutarotase [Oscillospiraceae bacterium]
MSIQKQHFDTLPDGREVYRYLMRNESGMSVAILDLGGAIQQILVPDRRGRYTDVVGGYDNAFDYFYGDGYQGALIGRVGNRIARGKFTLGGKEYSLYINNGVNHLHGGKEGFSHKIWSVTAKDGSEPALELSYVSPDGEEGYPGTLTVTVTYTLTARGGLSIRYVATTDKTTVLNLTNHCYFNLGGFASGKILDHVLMMDADTYLPTDETLIPTGELRSVAGTPFDFRAPKEVGKDFCADNVDLKIAGGYDHCFNFTGGATAEPTCRATLYHKESGREMKVYTNQPAVQFYSGNFLNNADHPFKGGYPQGLQNALCLETQHMPDSINQKGFTNTVLHPGEVYDYTTEYVFSVR